MVWPEGIKDKILLLVTDAAAYMIKAAKKLQLFYPNMIHVTCIVHELNKVAEQTRPFSISK